MQLDSKVSEIDTMIEFIGESVHTCSLVHDAELWRCGNLGIMGNCLNCEFDDANASPCGKHEYNEMNR